VHRPGYRPLQLLLLAPHGRGPGRTAGGRCRSRRTDTFLLRDFARRSIAAGPSTSSLSQVLDGGILLARLPKGALGEETARLLGSFIVAGTWQAAAARARTPEHSRIDATLSVDEAHNFLTLPYPLEDMLAKARSYRLSMLLAHIASHAATEAAGYAKQADQSAKDAAASANSARNAQVNAENAAASAVTSATSAQYSADAARSSSNSAWTAVQDARASATAAGKDDAAAQQAVAEAYRSVVVKQQQESARFQQWAEEQRKQNNQLDDDSSWIPDWLRDTANAVNPYVKAFWDNSPQLATDLVESLGGAALTQFGIGEGIAGGGGGLLLCIETLGGGCVEAVAAVSGGLAAAGGGLAMADNGVHRFSDDFGQALREAQEERAAQGTCAPGDCFRGARPGESPSFLPKPNDYKVDAETGFVKESHGVSVFDNSGSVTSKGFIPHQIDESSFPDTLRVIQRGKDPRHFEIVPAPGANLTPERYAEELSKIKVRK